MMKIVRAVLGVFCVGALGALGKFFFPVVRHIWKKVSGWGKPGQKRPDTGQGQKGRSQKTTERKTKGEKQIDLLLSLRAEADRAEAEIVYSRLFDKIGGAVQKLLALAEETEERENYERLVESEIQFPIQAAFRKFQVSFTDRGISLPVKRTEAEQETREQLEELSECDIAEAIQECRSRIERAGRYQVPKTAINNAAGGLRSLAKTPVGELEPQKMKAIAEEIREAFVRSGIYPLFRRDERVLERPDLCALFIEVRGRALIWPGLFIEIDNRLQLYGNFQGTCHRGEWER